MNPTLMLRIAAGITLLYCAGHTAGMPWTPSKGSQELALLETMKSVRFEVMGSVRTYWDFYIGFGVAISGYLALQAIVLWQLALLAKNAVTQIRPMIAAFFVAFVFNAIVVWEFFFAAPLAFASGIVVCLALAFISAKPPKAA